MIIWFIISISIIATIFFKRNEKMTDKESEKEQEIVSARSKSFLMNRTQSRIMDK